MSSEMREWKFGDRVEWQDSPGNWHEAVIIGQREGHDCTEYEAILADGDRVAWYAFGRFRALLARTESGPSLLCQSDACAHKGTAHNFCTPRTEAGADGAVGYVSADGNAVWLTEGSFSLKPAAGTNLFTHPQDASGDAELIEAAGTYEEAVRLFGRTSPSASRAYDRMTAVLNAMQAKEAK